MQFLTLGSELLAAVYKNLPSIDLVIVDQNGAATPGQRLVESMTADEVPKLDGGAIFAHAAAYWARAMAAQVHAPSGKPGNGASASPGGRLGDQWRAGRADRGRRGSHVAVNAVVSDSEEGLPCHL